MAGIVSAERWETREQSNYTVSGDLFVFGGLRYEHDLFDGFEYQASATGGGGQRQPGVRVLKYSERHY